jgi:hypothetical protein
MCERIGAIPAPPPTNTISASVSLCGLAFSCQADIVTLIQACTGHATLHRFEIDMDSADGGQDDATAAAAVGAALAAMVDAHMPCLYMLDLAGKCTPAQLEPLCAALARGGHGIKQARHREDGAVNNTLHAAIVAGAKRNAQ